MKQRLGIPLFVLLSSALFATSACAADDSAKAIFRTGFDLGGDKLVHVIYTNGNTADINAGNGFYVSGGGSFPITDKLEFDATIGYELAGISGSNADITWSYFPVDAIVLYKVGRFALGGGLTDHINPSLSGSGIASSVNTNYDDAIGSVVEADYMFGKSLLIGLRATTIDYKTGSYTSTGNSVGLSLMFKI